MKKAAKVFIWFGIIFQFYFIVPIVIGVIALKRINRATTRKELQDFGVTTMLLCSFLGGLFMLLIDESELGYSHYDGKALAAGNEKNMLSDTVVKYEKVVLTDKEKRALNGGKTAKATKILMFSIIALSLLGLILSLSCIAYLSEDSYDYNNWHYNHNKTAAWIAIFPGIIQAFAISIPALIYFCDKQWASIHCCISFATSTPALAAFFGTAISAACIGEHALFILLTIISFVLFVLVVVTVSINYKVFYKRKRKVEVSRLEFELERLENLLKRGVVKENEYSKMRASLIEKCG